MLASLSLSEPSSPSGRAPLPSPGMQGVARQRSVRTERRRERCMRILRGSATNGNGAGAIDLGALKSFAWGGVPAELRPIVWQLLLVSGQSCDHSQRSEPSQPCRYRAAPMSAVPGTEPPAVMSSEGRRLPGSASADSARSVRSLAVVLRVGGKSTADARTTSRCPRRRGLRR